jgi:hypothetical protein
MIFIEEVEEHIATLPVRCTALFFGGEVNRRGN